MLVPPWGLISSQCPWTTDEIWITRPPKKVESHAESKFHCTSCVRDLQSIFFSFFFSIPDKTDALRTVYVFGKGNKQQTPGWRCWFQHRWFPELQPLAFFVALTLNWTTSEPQLNRFFLFKGRRLVRSFSNRLSTNKIADLPDGSSRILQSQQSGRLTEVKLTMYWWHNGCGFL